MLSINFNIFQYIDLNKILEAEVFINYHRRKNNCNFYSKRRLDTQRYERIRNLKSNLNNSLRSFQFANQEMNLINQFVRSVANMYRSRCFLINFGFIILIKFFIKIILIKNNLFHKHFFYLNFC